MFTIGEYAMRAMVKGYREMRATGAMLPGIPSGTPLTYAQNEKLFRFITTEVFRMSDVTAGFNTAVIPHIVSLAYAIAMTEQFLLGSDMYCAWRDYELHLHGVAIAINANRR